MKYFQFLTLLFGLAFFTYSCETKESPERKKLYNEVMAIHDDVMPEMKTINTLERAIKKKIDSNGSQDSIVMMKATLKRLETADQMMMNWMHELNVPNKSVPDAEAIAYLKEEKIKIERVSIKMRKAIESGQAIVEKF